MADASRPFLVISDLQLPFESKKALPFCTYLKKHYRIPDENILCVGDETDGYHASDYPKDPDAHVSPINEIQITRERIKQWADVFPRIKIATSNHGLRWIKKATNAQIPSELLRSYGEIFHMPETWEFREEWRFSQGLNMPFRMIHGMGYSGINGHRNAALDAQMSTVIGHLHSHAAVSWIQTAGGQRMWAVNSGCMIDIEAFAFRYEKYNRVKPQLGCVVIGNKGTMPFFVPLY